jgi:hypothetical protein
MTIRLSLWQLCCAKGAALIIEARGNAPELCCAEGAVSLLAWGNAPGFVVPKNTSAESAIHFLGEFDA